MVTPVDIVKANPELFCVEFESWLPENLHVWRAFVHEAFRVREAGFEHYSARTIIHVLRHHSAVTERASAWKINNDHSPYLARLFDLMYPEAAGMWEYRETTKPRGHRNAYEEFIATRVN